MSLSGKPHAGRLAVKNPVPVPEDEDQEEDKFDRGSADPLSSSFAFALRSLFEPGISTTVELKARE